MLASVIATGLGILWRHGVGVVRAVGVGLASPWTFYAERQRDKRKERDADRQHQLNLVEAIIEGLNGQQRSQADSIMALARAQEKQSEAFGDWLKLFTQPGTSEPVVDQETQELLATKARFDALKTAGAPIAMPPEFALAWALKFEKDMGIE